MWVCWIRGVIGQVAVIIVNLPNHAVLTKFHRGTIMFILWSIIGIEGIKAGDSLHNLSGKCKALPHYAVGIHNTAAFAGSA